MTTTTVISFAATLAALAAVLLARTGRDTSHVRAAASPLDEAHRILARRYARGQISYEEYRRMAALLGQ